MNPTEADIRSASVGVFIDGAESLTGVHKNSGKEI